VVGLVILASLGACTGLLGIDQPNVESGEVVDAGDAGAERSAPDATSDAGRDMGSDVGPEAAPTAITLIDHAGMGQVEMGSIQLAVSQPLGAALIATVYWTTTASPVEVSDSAHSGWTQTPVVTNQYDSQIWYATNVAAYTNNVVTVTVPGWDAGGFQVMGGTVLVYTGIARISALDVTTPVQAGAGTEMQTGSVTTTGRADLLLGVFVNTGTTPGTMAAGPGFAAEWIDTSWAALVEDNPPYAADAGPHTLMATYDAGGSWMAFAAAFKAE
jgi:hypothetical protein